MTDGWGADVVFGTSGHPDAIVEALEVLRPGGQMIYIGIPEAPVTFDIPRALPKEISIKLIFRYANVYPRAIQPYSSSATPTGRTNHTIQTGKTRALRNVVRSPSIHGFYSSNPRTRSTHARRIETGGVRGWGEIGNINLKFLP